MNPSAACEWCSGVVGIHGERCDSTGGGAIRSVLVLFRRSQIYVVVWVLGSGFVVVAWALVGVVCAVVMAAWAAVVAVQIGLGAGIMQGDSQGQMIGELGCDVTLASNCASQSSNSFDQCSGIVGIDHRQEVRFDRRRCNSRCSGAIQASPDLSLSLSLSLSLLVCVWGVLHLRAWYGGWVVAFWLMNFGCGMDVWVLEVVVLMLVGVVWVVVMAAWAAVVAVQFGLGSGIMQGQGQGQGIWMIGELGCEVTLASNSASQSSNLFDQWFGCGLASGGGSAVWFGSWDNSGRGSWPGSGYGHMG
ncbi:P-loop containing nucleoside triphosphate hydrolases superfamily protein [Actinidia rufa]|uniref:P-loop containing nucleoside triphosphate hydrolases superfamily protein n=1 Tax=Actinidia rufa TaxID=165716 RepID=A0A7J0H1P0_9ERIC|nr:P-loop containing nucleoside triphosphate hydrolases superfamily protein [Actinidia rufa]